MKTSRLFLIILMVIVGILVLTVFVRMLTDRDTSEITLQSSNIEFSQWELPVGVKARLGKGSINDIKFSSDGTRFAVATTIGVWMYDAITGEEIALFKGDRQDIKGIAFTQDENVLIGANALGQIPLWNVENGELNTILVHEDFKPINTAVFSEDGKKLVTTRGLDKAQVWHIDDKSTSPTITYIELFERRGRQPLVALTPDKRFLATTILEKIDSYPIHVWNTATGEHEFTLKGNPRWIKCMVFSPDGKTLASGDEYETIHLWDIETKTSRAIFKANVNFQSLAYSPNGKLLASGSGDGSVRIWDATVKEQKGITGKISQFLPSLNLKGHKDKVSKMAFSPDGKLLLTGSLDGTIHAWDTTTGSQKYTCPGHSAEISEVGITKNEGSLTTVHSGENQLLHWNINIGHHVSGSYYRNKRIEAISPDANTVVIRDWRAKKRLRLYDTSKQRVHAILDGPGSVFAFSLDEKRFASSSTENRVIVVHLWEIPNRSQPYFKRLFSRSKTIQPRYTLEGHRDRVFALVFSSDRKMLASGGTDKIIHIWDVETGSKLFTLTSDRDDKIRALAFSPDGKMLASGGFSRSILFWDVTTGKLKTECQNVEYPTILKYSPDGNTLISGTYNGKIQLLDAHSRQLLSTHLGHSSWVNDLLFIDDGKTLVSASNDGTMLLWDWEHIAQVNR